MNFSWVIVFYQALKKEFPGNITLVFTDILQRNTHTTQLSRQHFIVAPHASFCCQRQDLQPTLLIHHQSFTSPGISFIGQNFSIANCQSQSNWGQSKINSLAFQKNFTLTNQLLVKNHHHH
ncbi:MAG: hypothetical protein Q7T40_11555 [Methylobacter sp.]|nr:hypothetical protein [Methylobacter sp.]